MQRLPQACLILVSLFFILEGIYVKLKPEELRLYAVTDRAWTDGTEGVCRQVEAAVRGGATFVQLREKHLEHDEFLAEARAVAALCRALGVKCVINDDVDIAVESGADGVHVGQEDLEASLARERLGPGKIIGVSAHNAAEARRAEAAGADYIGSGAAFATSTKETAAPIGPEGLRAVVEAVSIPVVAIGGISRENIGRLEGLGLAGVAVVSALFAAPDVEAAARELSELAGRL